MKLALAILALAVVAPRAAHANHPCASDGITAAGGSGPTVTVPVNCPVEFYVGDNVPRPLTVYRNGAAVTGFPFAVVATGSVTRDRSVCSSLDAQCWTWIRDVRAVEVVGYTPGTPFMAGDTVALGPAGGPAWTAVSIGPPGDCPPRRVFDYEMCADPLGGPDGCSGGAFTCGGDGGVDHDGGLACDGGVGGAHLDAPTGGAHHDGGGCSTGGGTAGAGLGAGLAVVALARRRRRWR